jgi:hypothetical protein
MDNRPLHPMDHLRSSSWSHRRPGGLGLWSLFSHAWVEVKGESAMNPILILCIAAIVVEAALAVVKLIEKRR